MITRRAFGAAMRALRRRSDRHGIDPRKVRAVSKAARLELVHFIVRSRGPVLQDFIFDFDADTFQWLAASGYLHWTRGKESGHLFLHTAEHSIR